MKPDILKACLKKVPFLLLIYMLGGAFCRWYQLAHELQYDGGLATGSYMHKVLLILTLSFLAGFAFLLSGLKNIASHKDCFAKAILPCSVTMISGILLIIGNVLQLIYPANYMDASTAVALSIIQYLPYFGVVAGVLITVASFLTLMGRTPSPLFYMLVSLYLVMRLIVSFQTWNMDPSIHDYIYGLLAAITAMFACFQIAGFGFGEGKRRITAFWCLCAAFFAAVSMPDFIIPHGKISLYYDGPSFFIRDYLPGLLVNASLLLVTLTHGIQLLYAPDPAEEPPVEENSAEDP